MAKFTHRLFIPCTQSARNRRRGRIGSSAFFAPAALLALLAGGCAAAPAMTVRSFATETATPQDPPASVAGYHGNDESVRFVDDPATLDRNVPTPQSVIGHAVGSKSVRYDTLVAYLKALDAASDLVTLRTHGMTHEGRPLYHAIITSQANHARLDEIKADNARLADPRGLSDADADRIIANNPAIAWMAYSIHGDEVSPCDAAMQVCYLLAAGTDDATKRLRDDLVIIIDPLQNPDGRERYLSQIETLIGKVPNPDYNAMHHAGLWSAGRGNHYLFDMNRDWLPITQPETRGRIAAINQWHPQLALDSHEMGGLDTYLFDPPREPLNEQLADSVMDKRRQLSRDQAAAFNREGWSYYTGEWYDEYYPGYTGSWTSLVGAAGLLYEQSGISGSLVKRPSGEIFTYRLAVKQNVVGTFANLITLADNREQFLREFHSDQRWQVSDEGPLNETFLLPPGDDPARYNRLLDLFDQHAIEYTIAADSFTANDAMRVWRHRMDEVELPAGTAILRSNQPRRRLMHALLDFDPRMTDEFLKKEREDLEKHKGTRSYDVTAWSLPLAFGLDAYWASDVPDNVRTRERTAMQGAVSGDAAPAYGYLIDPRNSSVTNALVALYDRNCNVRAATEPFTLGGVAYPAGTMVIRRHENPDDLDTIVRRVATDHAISIVGVGTALVEEGLDLGGQSVQLLHPPRVAIGSQWPTSTTSFGANWWVLDERLGLRASPVNLQNIGGMDLRKYNVLILPSGGVGRVLEGGALENVKTWVRSGGTLIAIAGAASSLASEEMGLSSVRLRSDVLDELDEYTEALDREDAARNIEVDIAALWDDSQQGHDDPDNGSASDPLPRNAGEGQGGGSDSSLSSDERKRLDRWQQLFSPQGSYVRCLLDNEHWLTYGMGEQVAALFAGSDVLMSKYPIQTPARLADVNHLRLSGLLWPEARGRMAGGAYATVERFGNGQVILFADEPWFRGHTEGTGRMFINAVLLGPGMGTNQPLPW